MMNVESWEMKCGDTLDKLNEYVFAHPDAVSITWILLQI